MREIPKISRWIEGIQTTCRTSTVGTAYEHETKGRRTAALQAIVDEGMRFNPIVEYVPGKQLVIADALSRKPLVGRESRIDDIELSDDITALVDAVQQNWPVMENRLTEIRGETSTDPIIKPITNFIANGWPSHESTVPHSVRDFYRERGLLLLNHGVVTYKPQLVMAPTMRDDALRRLHESHQGISKCRERAASAIWWPGIGRDIKRLIDRCDTYRRNRPTQREQPLRLVKLSVSSVFACDFVCP